MSGTARTIGGAILLVLRLATAGLFIWAATVKLSDPVAFATSINGFKILPRHHGMLQPLAFMVPWTELVCAAALVVGFWGRSAALVLGGMLAIFAAAVVSVILRPDISVECGCFGKFTLLCPPGEADWCNVIQNGILIALALPVMIWGPGLFSWDRWAENRCRMARLDDAEKAS